MVAVNTVLLLVAVVQPDAPENVVRTLYEYVVTHKPLGIPDAAQQKAISPLLSTRLAAQLTEARRCEDDYRRQHSREDGKPGFGWLEMGLFSGANEMALPAEVAITRTEAAPSGSSPVYLRFTYRETFATFGRAPNPANSFQWNGLASVVLDNERYAVDDVLTFDDEAGSVGFQLSRAFEECSGSRWVGRNKRR